MDTPQISVWPTAENGQHQQHIRSAANIGLVPMAASTSCLSSERDRRAEWRGIEVGTYLGTRRDRHASHSGVLHHVRYERPKVDGPSCVWLGLALVVCVCVCKS